MVGSAQKWGAPRTRVVGQQDFPQGMEPAKQMGSVVSFNGALMTLLARKRTESRKTLCMVNVYGRELSQSDAIVRWNIPSIGYGDSSGAIEGGL
jgi:thymidine phosphorylase